MKADKPWFLLDFYESTTAKRPEQLFSETLKNAVVQKALDASDLFERSKLPVWRRDRAIRDHAGDLFERSKLAVWRRDRASRDHAAALL